MIITYTDLTAVRRLATQMINYKQTILHYLFKTGEARNRIGWEWCKEFPKKDHLEEMCTCDLVYELFGPSIKEKYSGRVKRYEGGLMKSGYQMVMEWFGFLSLMFLKVDAKYELKDYVPLPSQVLAMSMCLNIGDNMKHLPMLSSRPNYPRAGEKGSTIPEVALVAMFYDMKRFNRPLKFLLEEVFQYNEKVKGPKLKGNGKIENQDMVKKSLYNANFGSRYINNIPYSNIIMSTENVIEKLPKALMKMNRTTNYKEPMNSFLGRNTKKICDIMSSSSFLDVKKYFKKFGWVYSTDLLQEFLISSKKNTSAGVWRTPIKTMYRNRKLYQVGANQHTKGEVSQTVAEIIDQFALNILRGQEAELPMGTTQTALKHETFSVGEMSDAEILKMWEKVRIYHISSVLDYYLGVMVGDLRHHIERGKVIKVGMNFQHGGAQDFAEYHNYKIRGQIWSTGDISGLDMSLKSALLALYHAFSTQYYDFATMSIAMKNLFKKMRCHVSTNLSQKICQMFSTIWVWLDGIMPSGAFDTSHGDSWCMVFIFVAFLVWVMEKYANMVEDIMTAIHKRLITLSVYGDDDNQGIPGELNGLIGRMKFNEFLDQWGMVGRDVKIFDNFLTRIDKNNEIEKEGPSFLKVHFVHKDNLNLSVGALEVYPWRKTQMVCSKIAYGKGEMRCDATILMSAIGLVNVSYGTNLVSYNFLSLIFNTVKKNVKDTWFEDFVSMCKCQGKMKEYNSIMKTYNLNRDLDWTVFPSRVHLLSQHEMNREKHNLSNTNSFFSFML